MSYLLGVEILVSMGILTTFFYLVYRSVPCSKCSEDELTDTVDFLKCQRRADFKVYSRYGYHNGPKVSEHLDEELIAAGLKEPDPLHRLDRIL